MVRAEWYGSEVRCFDGHAAFLQALKIKAPGIHIIHDYDGKTPAHVCFSSGQKVCEDRALGTVRVELLQVFLTRNEAAGRKETFALAFDEVDPCGT
jgi:hypothetical protein